MRRREQFADLVRIDQLAAKMRGELATAIVLAQKVDRLDTIDAAAAYAVQNQNQIPSLLNRELYFDWISRAATNISRATMDIDFKKIGVYDAASQSTKKLFEDRIEAIGGELIRNPDGVYQCIREIFSSDSKYNSYTAETIDCVKNSKLQADRIRRYLWRIRHPYYYIVIDWRVRAGLILLFLLSVPIWYLFGAHGQSIATAADAAPTLIASDYSRLAQLIESQNAGPISKAAQVIYFVWHFLIALPCIFLVPEVAFRIARIRSSSQGKRLRKYEKLFGDIGRELQKVVPTPPKWASLELKMTGDINIAAGKNIQQNVKSIISNSYNKVKGDYDSETDNFLKQVGETVEQSGNPNAAKHYAGLVDNLKEGDKSMARTVWEGLLKIVPAVGSIAGAGAAIAKLIGAAP